MAYTTQKDVIEVGFLNETLDPTCTRKAGVKLRSYASVTDVRALDNRRLKQAQYLTDLVACRTYTTAGPDTGDRRPATEADELHGKGDYTGGAPGDTLSENKSFPNVDSLLFKTTKKLIDIENLLQQNEKLKEDLVNSADELKKISLENKEIKDILKTGQPSKISEFENKINELKTSGKLNNDDVEQLMKLRNQIGDRQKAIEILEAENNALKKLTEKLSARANIPEIKIENETSTDIPYLQNTINSLKNEIGVLRAMEDKFVEMKIDHALIKEKYDKMSEKQKKDMLTKDSDRFKAILDERNKLRDQLDKMIGMEGKIAKLREKAMKADELEQELEELKGGSKIALESLEDCKRKMHIADKLLEENCELKRRLAQESKIIEELSAIVSSSSTQLQRTQKENCCLKKKLRTSTDVIDDYEFQVHQLMCIIDELRSAILSKMKEMDDVDASKKEIISTSKTCLEKINKELELRHELENELKKCREKLGNVETRYKAEKEKFKNLSRTLNQFKQISDDALQTAKKESRLSAKLPTEVTENELENLDIENVTNELKDNLNECKQNLIDFENKISNLEKELNSCKRENDELRQQNKLLTSENTPDENLQEILNLRNKLLQEAEDKSLKDKEYEDLKKMFDDLKKKIEDKDLKDKECEDLKKKYENLKKEVEDKDLKERENSKKMLNDLESEIKEKENQAKDYDDLKKMFDKLKKEVENKDLENKECEELKKKFNDMKKEVDSKDLAAKECEELKKKYNDLKKEIESKDTKKGAEDKDKAMECEDLKKKLDDLKGEYDSLIKSNDCESIRTELENQKKLLNAAKNELEQQRNEINKYAERVRELQNQNEVCNSLNNKYEGQLRDKDNELKTLQDKTIEIEKKLRDTYKESDNKETKCDEYKSALTKVENDLKKLESIVNSLESDNKNLQKELSQKQEDINNLKKQLEKCKAELDEERETKNAELRKLKSEKNRSNADLVEKNDEIEKLNGSLARKDANIKDLRNENERLSEELSKVGNELKNLKDEKNRCNEEIHKKNKEIGDLKAEKDGLNTKISKLTQDFDKIKAEKDHLLKQVSNKEAEIKELKNLLDRSRDDIQNIKSELENCRKENTELGKLLGEIEKEREKNKNLKELLDNYEKNLAETPKPMDQVIKDGIGTEATNELQNAIKKLKQQLEIEKDKNDKLTDELNQCKNKLQSVMDRVEKGEDPSLKASSGVSFDRDNIRLAVEKALDALKKEHMASLKKLQEMHERQLKDLQNGNDKEIYALQAAKEAMRSSLENIRQKVEKSACTCDKKGNTYDDSMLTKLQCICKKVLDGGIECLTLPELTYLHTEVYKAGLKLRPELLKCSAISSAPKCCKCAGFACCLPNIPREKEKVFVDRIYSLEKDVDNANKILQYLKTHCENKTKPKDRYSMFRPNDEINNLLKKVSEDKTCLSRRSTSRRK